MKASCLPRSQRGIVLPLVIVALATIIGMAGLAMDVGFVFLFKTRLQNALDAGALSGAATLNATSGNTDQARADALEAFGFHSAQLGLDGVNPVVEFSPTLNPFAAGGADPFYVRMRVENVPVPLRLVTVIPGVADTLPTRGSAVAAPLPLGLDPGDQICDLVPLVVSSDPAADQDCSDGSCFGYSVGEQIVLKSGSQSQGPDSGDETPTSGPGNFNLLRLGCGSGGACVRQELAGANSSCVAAGGTVDTEPGNTVGPTAQGLNTRFGIYQGGGVSSENFPPDAVTTLGISYSQYEARLAAGSFDNPPPSGVPRRRVMSVIFSDFGAPSGGTNTLSVDGIGCFFLVDTVSQGGNQEVTAELIEDCNPEGPSVPQQRGNGTFFTIVLYKDNDSGDS